MPQFLPRRVCLAATLATAALLSLPAALAQAPSWPTRPVRILVGFPGGSSPDLVARALAEPLSQALGQPVVVETKLGAGGNIAADQVAKSTDGHTLGVMINGNLTIAKLLNPKTPYDPARDLVPVSLVGTAPLVLAARADLPGNSIAEFFAAARAGGDQWNYGTPGVGTVGHIGMELLKARSGIAPVHVPYPGNPQVITAMVGGQLNLSLLPPALAMAQVRAGKLKAIGVTSAGRSPLVPELPSLAEGGIPGFQLEIWTAVAAPASMPAATVARLSALVSEIVRTPDMRARLFQQGWQVAGTSSEGLANRMKSDTALLGGVILMQGIKAD
ncbi:tripartite tricarboxylate transporter substrate binding protein [Pseudorhodoferax sp. Leaf267]|uniref:Bug family tripartite tricarboxylate transporter substrate binding protein n=1 Tax=Pseudorhodoferax sp. Leaf267 TaxID=1736316 RepID=UPI0007015CB1|nr:tripartite tricarboxylate transporter substrate-binding protein [Pseudorhodoferax sp. Leaf267]KQP20522.1 receptor [Pseudorhodoferax sp. Leaf267]